MMKAGRAFLVCTAATVLLTVGTYASATPYVQNNLSFTTANQSMWGSGNAAGFNFNYFLGQTWNTPSAQVGGIAGSQNTVIIPGSSYSISYYEPKVWIPTPSFSHPFAGHYSGCGCWKSTTVSTPPVTGDTRTGALFDAQTYGKAGFDLSTSADSGSVNASVVYDASLNLPAANSVSTGQFFNLNPNSTVANSSTFSTQSPTISGSVDAVLGAKATFGAQACAIGFGCTPDNSIASTTVGFDPKTLPLVSFNTPDSPGQIKVLGVLDPSAFQFGSPIQIPPSDPAQNFGDVTVYVPNVTTTGTVGSGGALTGNGTGNLLDLNANLTGLILNAFGLPAVLGTSIDLSSNFNINYDLVKVEYGPSLKLLQDFKLDPTLMVNLNFDHPVDVAGLGTVTSFTSPWDSLPSISLLDNTPVTATPTFWLNANFTNDTTLGIFGQFTLDALDAGLTVSAFGLSWNALSLGPLYSFTNTNDFYNLPPLFDESFNLGGFDPIAGDPFVLSARTVPAPPELWLCALALALLVFFRGRRKSAEEGQKSRLIGEPVGL